MFVVFLLARFVMFENSSILITGSTGSFGKNALGLCWRNISRGASLSIREANLNSLR